MLLIESGLREHTPCVKTQKMPSMACSARAIPGPRCFTPGVCSHRIHFGTHFSRPSERFRPLKSRIRVKLAATPKLNAQGTRSEEESVPRQGRCGPSGQELALAPFRSDRVSCAGSISLLTGPDCATTSGGHRAAFLFSPRRSRDWVPASARPRSPTSLYVPHNPPPDRAESAPLRSSDCQDG